MNNAQGVSYREGYFPGLVGRIAGLHGIFYADHWGVGSEFEILMAREVCDFVEDYREGHDLLLSAIIEGPSASATSAGESVVGTIVIIAPRAGMPEGWAQLRWFLLDPRMHSRGIGWELLDRALRFVRSRFQGCFLWTVTGLPASMHMYEKRGFVRVAHEVDTRYGASLTSVRLDLDLGSSSTPAEGPGGLQ